MLNCELSKSAATGCARASDEFRTLNIRQITSAVAVEAYVNDAEQEPVRHCHSRRGEGGAARCAAAGLKKPEAYSQEYIEEFFGPSTTQMVADHSLQ